MILQEMKKQLLAARKSRNATLTTIYSTLIGELEAIGKNDGNRETTDDEAIKKLKKWVSSIDETIKLQGKPSDAIQLERNVCMQYLPQLMTDEQIKVALKEAIDKFGKDQGMVMKWFKTTYPNKYDGSRVSVLFKEMTQ